MLPRARSISSANEDHALYHGPDDATAVAIILGGMKLAFCTAFTNFGHRGRHVREARRELGFRFRERLQRLHAGRQELFHHA